MVKAATTLLFLRLPIVIFLIALGQGGVVFCHGSDGHVALEPALYGHCESSWDTFEQHGDHDADASLIHARGCHDVSLTAHAVGNAKQPGAGRQEGIQRLALGREDARPWPVVVASSLPDRPWVHSPRSVSPLSFLTTIVLLL